MNRQEERINAKKVFQNGTRKEKLEYLWDYYKWHFLILIVILGILISLIYNFATKKEYVLQGYFLNSYGSTDVSIELTDDFLAEYPIDTKKQEILIGTSFYYDTTGSGGYEAYQMVQGFLTKIAAGEVDFVVADVGIMQELAYSGIFIDLSDVLSTEQINKYESDFLYYDKVVKEELDDIEYTEETAAIELIEVSNPDAMEEPIPAMIQISNMDIISGLYPGSNEEYAFAFVANGTNTNTAIEFLEFIYE